MNIELTQQQHELLTRLMRSSKDDPRIHGLIGTCFWSLDHTKEEESNLKDTWTSIEERLKESADAG